MLSIHTPSTSNFTDYMENQSPHNTHSSRAHTYHSNVNSSLSANVQKVMEQSKKQSVLKLEGIGKHPQVVGMILRYIYIIKIQVKPFP
jgi:hypothetical protein